MYKRSFSLANIELFLTSLILNVSGNGDSPNHQKRKRKSRGVECIVPDCFNTMYDENYAKTHFHFFQFPQRDPQKKIWLSKIKRVEGKDNFKVSYGAKICNEHFHPHEITKTLNGMWKLVPGVLPSVFPGRNVTMSANSKKRKTLNSLTGRQNIQEETATQEPVIETAFEELEIAVSEGSDPESTQLQYHQQLLERITQLEAENQGILQAKEIAEKERDTCKQQLREIRTEIMKPKFGVNVFKDSDSDIRFYTGFPNFERFMTVLNLINPGENGENMQLHHTVTQTTDNVSGCEHDHCYVTRNCNKKKCSLPVQEQFFLVMCRLRQGMRETHLAHLFDISQTTVSRYCITWINYMYLKLGSLNIWTSRENIRKTMPQDFKEKYPRTRCIIDCTEIFVQVPESLVESATLWSNYKHHVTMKGLIGINPAGAVTFISQLYPGSASDREIVLRSGFLNQQLWEVGDEVMADRGFTIEDLLRPLGVGLNIPAFMRGRSQQDAEEVIVTQQIASTRIHVERHMQKVKTFHVLDGSLPVNMFGTVNQIWTVCNLLTLFMDPIISPVEQVAPSVP